MAMKSKLILFMQVCTSSSLFRTSILLTHSTNTQQFSLDRVKYAGVRKSKTLKAWCIREHYSSVCKSVDIF